MTNEELRQTINNMEIGIGTMYENEYMKVRKNVFVSILENYRELLYFRELKTPKKAEQDECAEHIFYCPNCKGWFNGYHKPHHCECGQALDWSEENGNA